MYVQFFGGQRQQQARSSKCSGSYDIFTMSADDGSCVNCRGTNDAESLDDFVTKSSKSEGTYCSWTVVRRETLKELSVNRLKLHDEMGSVVTRSCRYACLVSEIARQKFDPCFEDMEVVGSR